MTKGLSIKSICIERDERILVRDVSFDLHPGEVVALIGPNGAGKSLTLQAAVGLIPVKGIVTLDGQSIATMAVSERSRRIAYLPQSVAVAWPVHVRDVVALGRFAYGAAPGRLQAEDARAVEAALCSCGLEALAERRVDTLSGGERARVHCARVLCSETPLLVADEPVAALDPAQAFHILDLLTEKARQGLGLLLVLHDIALAAKYADRLVMLKEGQVLADGPISSVLTAENLAELYGIRSRVDGREVRLDGIL